MTGLRDSIERDGFAVIKQVVPLETVRLLIDSLNSFPDDASSRRRGNASFARRNLLDLPVIRELAVSTPLRAILEPILGTDAFPVRSILFDKHADANWVVPWHQDLSIAVKQRNDIPGFGPWSSKAGVMHVQPPVEILRQMLTIRLHLDDCGPDNGPLRVIPGSHHFILDDDALAACVQTGPEATCTVPPGGAVVMRPMLIHASSPARYPAHRRVVHLEYAAGKLPHGLEWHSAPHRSLPDPEENLPLS